MIETLRTLLHLDKKKPHTAAQLATAVATCRTERAGAATTLERLREGMGSALLDSSPDAVRTHEESLREAELATKRWDAVLVALETRHADRQAEEEAAALDRAAIRAAELVRRGRAMLEEYETRARAVAEVLRDIRALHEQWVPLARALEQAGRSNALIDALEGDGGAVWGPGWSAFAGCIQERAHVELPSTTAPQAIWGSFRGRDRHPLTPTVRDTTPARDDGVRVYRFDEHGKPFETGHQGATRRDFVRFANASASEPAAAAQRTPAAPPPVPSQEEAK